MQKKVESISQWKQTGQRASLGRISTRVGARVKSGSIGGHKFIFGERWRFGVRPYVCFGYGATKSVAYNMGADVLYNIIDNTNKIFGVFASVAIGGETWVANGKDYKPNGGKGEAYGNFQTILTINATKTTMRRPYALSLAYTYNF